jgi:hypothetical protein
VELDPPISSDDPAPFALVSALYSYFVDGAADRIIFAPHVDLEVRKSCGYGLIKVPNCTQSAELSMERYHVNSAVVRCECLVYRGPVMRIFLADMLFYRRPLKPNDCCIGIYSPPPVGTSPPKDPASLGSTLQLKIAWNVRVSEGLPQSLPDHATLLRMLAPPWAFPRYL